MKCIHGRSVTSVLMCSECTGVTGSSSVYMIGTPEIFLLGPSVAGTLEQRGEKYGPYGEMAGLAQMIKNAMRCARLSNWDDLPAAYRESLDMIATKVARILCGDADNLDTWHDIQGYAALIEHEIRGTKRPQTVAGSNSETT